MKRILPAIFSSVFLLGGCASVGEPERVPMTIEAVVQAAKDGKDAAAIIGEIQAARTWFDLTASQYAKLSRDGVPDAVLDFMQNGQLRMVARQGRREAQHDAWFYGRGYWGWGYGRAWAPRPYGVWLDGRYYKRSY